MTTSLTVDTPTIADAVARAARVAPSKGNAWDKAQGVQLAVRPGTNGPCRVTATDLESTYFHRVNVIAAEGDPIDWRIPSQLLASFLSTLPMEAGRTVSFSDDNGLVRVVCGKTSGVFRLIADPLPVITPFNPKGMLQVDDFAQKIEQVAWAVATDPGPLAGVRVDGTDLWGCNRYRLARIPCVVPITQPITVPMLKLASLIKNSGEVMLRATNDRLEIMPDIDTQLTCTLYQENYPNVSLLVDGFAMVREYTVHREALCNMLERLLTLAKGERYPQAKLIFTPADTGVAQMSMSMTVEDLGTVADELEVSALVTGADTELETLINPANLLSAAQHASRELITLHSTGDPLKPLLITDPSEFKTWVMPTRDV